MSKIFVQKCPVCGALNFLADENKPVKRCYNCAKIRVASVKPTEYKPEPEINEDPISPLKDPKTAEKEDRETGEWDEKLKKIEVAVGRDTDITDSEDDSVEWSDLLGDTDTSTNINDDHERHEITLTAISHGQLSFTIEAKDEEPYLLGRAANQSDFLASDRRVGNEHCFIVFKDGAWYVKDNHSKNGTAVNSKDIGLNGEHILQNGDELKLGHNPDSITFRITI